MSTSYRSCFPSLLSFLLIREAGLATVLSSDSQSFPFHFHPLWLTAIAPFQPWEVRTRQIIISYVDTSFYLTNLDKQRLRRNVDLKIQTLLRVAQEQAFRTICVKHHIVRSVESLVCGMCEEKGDTVDHIVSGCKKVAQKEHKRRRIKLTRLVFQTLCRKMVWAFPSVVESEI